VTSVFRIVHRDFVHEAFSGLGAAKYGGRWNGRRRPVVYAAENYSLALLESLAHVRSFEILQKNYVMLEARLPVGLITDLAEREYPRRWRKASEHPLLQQIGDRWLERGESAGWRVRSAVVEREFNVLLNPLHEDFSRVSVGDPEIIDLESRLLKF
jgi:RES domain-containing protein